MILREKLHRALPPSAPSALHTKGFVFRDYSRLLALLLTLSAQRQGH